MRRTHVILLAGLLFGAVLGGIKTTLVTAQTHAVHWLPERDWRTARDLCAQEHYRLAAAGADRFLRAQIFPTQSSAAIQRVEATYIRAISRLRLDDSGAERGAQNFIRETVDPALAQRTHLALARWYFRKERFADAIPHYRAAGIENLSNAEVAAAKFETAYSLFNNRQFAEATPLFLSIREVDGPYRSAGNYYYGLLAYNAGNYAEALKSFERIDEEPAYHDVVPYYIAELYYYSGDRQRALTEAMKLMRRPQKLYYDTELHLLAAQVLFEEGRYADALPYFEEYYQKTGKLRKEELYEMAYSHYRVQEWPAAIEKFKPLSAADDSLGQTAMYLLGDCYLQTGDKRGALGAFRLAADAPHIPALREAALLLAAKLAYESGYDAEATTRLSALLTEFPSSALRSEALTLRSDIFLRGAQYEDALASLEGVRVGSDGGRIRRHATYGLAMQKLSAADLTRADELLQSLAPANSYNSDTDAEDYRAAATFWRAEIAYRQERFAAAESLAHEFVGSAGAVSAQRLGSSIRPAAAFLIAGHAAFGQEKFAEAERAFAAAAAAVKGAPPEGATRTAALANATLRQADALMMQREWNRAAALYDEALNNGLSVTEADYARLQKAILLGLRGDNAGKSRLLQSLVDKGSTTNTTANARYELALTYLADDRPRDAIALLTPLAHSGGPLVPKALLRLGFAQSEVENDSAALQAYRRVVLEYPSSEERAAALDGVRAASIEMGRPQVYADLLKQSGLTDYSATLDSTYYAAAERAYERQAWADAEKRLADYLTQYPSGFFAPKAHYYRGRSLEMQAQKAEALRAYEASTGMPLHAFSEAASLRGAALAEAANDSVAAETFYTRLRSSASGSDGLQTAYLGLARGAASRADWTRVLLLTDTLASLPDLREASRAEMALLRGRALFGIGNPAASQEQFVLSEKSAVAVIAAESRYRKAEALLAQNKLAEAEAAADAAIRAGGDDRWVLRSYLLVADVLVKQGDFFNAKATLQSLAKNAKDPAVKAQAAERLTRVTELEKESSKLKTEEEGGPNAR